VTGYYRYLTRQATASQGTQCRLCNATRTTVSAERSTVGDGVGRNRNNGMGMLSAFLRPARSRDQRGADEVWLQYLQRLVQNRACGHLMYMVNNWMSCRVLLLRLAFLNYSIITSATAGELVYILGNKSFYRRTTNQTT